MANDINTYHIASHPELYENARSNAFKFIVNEKLNSILRAGVDPNLATDDDYLHNVQETLTIAVNDVSVPHFKLDSVQVRRGNSQVNFAGTPTFDSGSLELEDYVGAGVKDMIMGWQALAYDVTTDVVHLASNYKFDCYLKEYTPDFATCIRTWTLKGCWISEVSEDNFSNENHDKRQLKATVQYDRAIPQAGDNIV